MSGLVDLVLGLAVLVQGAGLFYLARGQVRHNRHHRRMGAWPADRPTARGEEVGRG